MTMMMMMMTATAMMMQTAKTLTVKKAMQRVKTLMVTVVPKAKMLRIKVTATKTPKVMATAKTPKVT